MEKNKKQKENKKYNTEKRNDVVDIAKGICIILMILGHCYSRDNAVLVLIYGFHMPFFFLISGALYCNKLRRSPESFHAGVQIRKLFVPYIISESAFALMLCVMNHPNGFAAALKTRAIQILSLKGVTVTWFLPCMAIATVLFICLWRYKSWLAYVCAAVCMTTGLLISPVGYAAVICRIMVAVGFIAIGFIASKVLTSKLEMGGGNCFTISNSTLCSTCSS